MACSFPTSASSVGEWLDALNLARYKTALEGSGLDISQLPHITEEKLTAAGVTIVGHRKRMLQAAKVLSTGVPAPVAPPGAHPGGKPADDKMDVDSSWNGREANDSGTLIGGVSMAASAMATAGAAAAGPSAQGEQPGPASGAQPMEGVSAAQMQMPPAVDVMALAAREVKQQPKPNSTSSIYITSSLCRLDTDEVAYCIAAVLHDRIQEGEAQSVEVRRRFPFFSEDNNPLYKPPPEPQGRGSESEGSDSSMKRARREVPNEDVIFHTLRSIFECARVPSECLIIALVYIERLIAVSACPMLVTSWRPILLSALILSQKVWDDRSLHNVDFSIFCPMFTLKEINFLEQKVRRGGPMRRARTHLGTPTSPATPTGPLPSVPNPSASRLPPPASRLPPPASRLPPPASRLQPPTGGVPLRPLPSTLTCVPAVRRLAVPRASRLRRLHLCLPLRLLLVPVAHALPTSRS
jgi:hypothetical protein